MDRSGVDGSIDVPVAELNALAADAFVRALAPFFEGAPLFLRRLAVARPFASGDDLFDRAGAIALAMPEDEQIELIDAHPRLGADPASVSDFSFREQGYEGDADAREHLAVELGLLNAAYEARFGFRFVIFVAGRPRAALIPILEERLSASRQDEIERALREVVAIAVDRWNTRAGRSEAHVGQVQELRQGRPGPQGEAAPR